MSNNTYFSFVGDDERDDERKIRPDQRCLDSSSVQLDTFAGHWGHVLARAHVRCRGSCKQATFAPVVSHQSKQTRHPPGAVFPTRPYYSGLPDTNLGTTVSPITNRAHARHLIASTATWINWISVVVVVLAVTCHPGSILRHRFLKPPARMQTPLAAFDGAHGRTWISPLTLCYDWRSARAGVCGRRRTTSAAASQKLSICCPAEQSKP
jgi:hypothetical protein